MVRKKSRKKARKKKKTSRKRCSGVLCSVVSWVTRKAGMGKSCYC